MRIKRVTALLCTLAMILCTLSACGGKEAQTAPSNAAVTESSTESAPALPEKAEYDAWYLGTDAVLTFYSDMHFTITGPETDEKGTFETDGGEVSITYEGGKHDGSTDTFALSDGYLIDETMYWFPIFHVKGDIRTDGYMTITNTMSFKETQYTVVGDKQLETSSGNTLEFRLSDDGNVVTLCKDGADGMRIYYDITGEPVTYFLSPMSDVTVCDVAGVEETDKSAFYGTAEPASTAAGTSGAYEVEEFGLTADYNSVVPGCTQVRILDDTNTELFTIASGWPLNMVLNAYDGFTINSEDRAYLENRYGCALENIVLEPNDVAGFAIEKDGIRMSWTVWNDYDYNNYLFECPIMYYTMENVDHAISYAVLNSVFQADSTIDDYAQAFRTMNVTPAAFSSSGFGLREIYTANGGYDMDMYIQFEFSENGTLQRISAGNPLT